MPREHEGRSFWCRCCRVEADGEFDDHGRPLGWYKIQNYGPAYQGELWGGWYCSTDCVVLVGMIALGVPEMDAAAWLRGETVGVQ